MYEVKMDYFIHIAILICIYIILAVSLNLIIGFTGQLNIGHAAFYGIGAYAAALLALSGQPFWLGLLAAMFFAGLGGLLISVPCLRLRGDYLAIATLGFGEIIRALMKNWTSLTRGPLGLPGIPSIEIFGITFSQPWQFLIIAALIAVIVVFLIRRMIKAPFGRVLRSIREDEIASQSLGKKIINYKVIAVVIGAMFAGVAGSLYAHYISFIDPTTFTLQETILMLCMVVLGGLGSIRGSIIGAALLIIIPEPLRFLSLPSSAAAALRQMLYAIILILIMLYRPQGLLGERRYTRNSNAVKKKRGVASA